MPPCPIGAPRLRPHLRHARRARVLLPALAVLHGRQFDATAAVAQGLDTGDGIPVHLTIPVDRPWVPLRILGTGKPASDLVEADVFLLTDDEPALLAGSGLRLERSEPASGFFLDDLRADRGMGWLRRDLWFTYLKVDATAGDLTYDRAVAPSRDRKPAIRDTGVEQAGSLPSRASTRPAACGRRC